MARTLDTERMFRAIPEDGSTIGNKSLRTKLQMDEDRYWKVRQELIDDGKISISRGRGGGVLRIKSEDIKEVDVEPVAGEYRTEASLYDPFLETIREKYVKDLGIEKFVCRKTAHAGKRKTGGLWTRPDITLIAIHSYPYYPVKSMDVVTFEVKHVNDFDITGVFETAAHTRFANTSYLAIYVPKGAEGKITDDDMSRVMDECERFGVGLLLFSDPKSYESFDFQIEPPRGFPDPADQNEFINTQFDEKLKQQLLGYF